MKTILAVFAAITALLGYLCLTNTNVIISLAQVLAEAVVLLALFVGYAFKTISELRGYVKRLKEDTDATIDTLARAADVRIERLKADNKATAETLMAACDALNLVFERHPAKQEELTAYVAKKNR